MEWRNRDSFGRWLVQAEGLPVIVDGSSKTPFQQGGGLHWVKSMWNMSCPRHGLPTIALTVIVRFKNAVNVQFAVIEAS